MRKAIAVLVLVFLVAFAGVCHASGFDFSSIPLKDMTVEELLSVRDCIDVELEARDYLDDEILEGVYIAGKDIGVGSFVFYYPEDYALDDHARIFVYQNAEAYAAHKIFDSPFVRDSDGVSIILEEGYIINVAICKCFCKPQTVNKSWAP